MQRRLISVLTATLVTWLGFPAVSHAGLVFYENDTTGFDAAVSGETFLGVEDFESSTLASNSSAAFGSPLSQTSTNSPFPSGIGQPITVDTRAIPGYSGLSLIHI